jgi:nitrogen regulatory protein PII
VGLEPHNRPEVRGTGMFGDGKVWVVPAEAVYRIRTGEVGEEAL